MESADVKITLDLVESGNDEYGEESKHEEEAPGHHNTIGNELHDVVDAHGHDGIHSSEFVGQTTST